VVPEMKTPSTGLRIVPHKRRRGCHCPLEAKATAFVALGWTRHPSTEEGLWPTLAVISNFTNWKEEMRPVMAKFDLLSRLTLGGIGRGGGPRVVRAGGLTKFGPGDLCDVVTSAPGSP
jgi:hypothetical protein